MLLLVLEWATIKLILWILGSVVLLGGSVYVIGNWPTIYGKTICVLGLPQTGKTLFFQGLQSQWTFAPDETNVNEVETFKLKNSSGETLLKIRDTKDIGGGDNFAIQYYGELIKNSDIIIFCCNIDEYINDKNSEAHVKDRLQYIYTLMEKYKKVKKDAEENGVRIILSYADQVEDRKEAMAYFVASISNEPYSYFAKHVATVNMTNQDEVVELITKKMIWK